MSIEKEVEEVKEEKVLEPVKKVKFSAGDDIVRIKSGFDEIDEKYDQDLQTRSQERALNFPEYNQIEIPSSQEIINQAVAEIDVEQAQKMKSVNEKYENKLKNLDLKEDAIIESLNQTQKQMDANLQADTEASQAKMISQGLERSSIMQNQLEGIKAEYEQDYALAIDNANRKIDEISLKRDLIKNEMNSALEKFDISYAYELEERIAKLNKEYDEQIENLRKANEKVSQQRKTLKQEWDEWFAPIKSEIETQRGYDKTVYILGQLQGLSKDEAIKILEDEEVKNSLGGWYRAVMDYVSKFFRG